MNISRDVEDAVPYNQTERVRKSVGAGVPDRPNTRTNGAKLMRITIDKEPKKPALAGITGFFVERPSGFEPPTSSVPRKCSAY